MRTKGDDLRYDMTLTFEEAAFGKSIEIQVPKLEACARCHGKGAEPGSGSITCPACHGRGEQIYSQGFLSVRRTCSSCGGAGQIVKQVCRDCRGEGYRQVTRSCKVTVPAGIADGNRLRVPGEGQPGGNGGPSATSTFSSPSKNIRSSNGRTTICTARFRSAWRRRCWEMRSKCRLSRGRTLW